MPLIVVDSELDSRRFDRRIGRATLRPSAGGTPAAIVDPDAVRATLQPYDIVILRAPLDDPLLSARLALVPGWRTFTADHLLYWEWRGGDLPAALLPPGHRITVCDDEARVAPVLRASFEGYRNHYTANPLLDPAAALEGYVEWAGTLIASGQATTHVVEDPAGAILAFGIVDWSVEHPDVRLAGVHPAAQRAGWYGHVVGALMADAAERDALPLHISTQSSNTNVMRAWARLGFVPFRALATYHLVAERLLS